MKVLSLFIICAAIGCAPKSSTITAQSINLVDASGRTRITLNAGAASPEITMFGEDGAVRMTISDMKDTPGFFLRDPSGRGVGILFRDKKGVIMVDQSYVGESVEGGGLDLTKEGLPQSQPSSPLVAPR